MESIVTAVLSILNICGILATYLNWEHLGQSIQIYSKYSNGPFLNTLFNLKTLFSSYLDLKQTFDTVDHKILVIFLFFIYNLVINVVTLSLASAGVVTEKSNRDEENASNRKNIQEKLEKFPIVRYESNIIG